MSRVKTIYVRPDRVGILTRILERIKDDPDELYYFEDLCDVVGSVDSSDREILLSALLSYVVVKHPWLLDRAAWGRHRTGYTHRTKRQWRLTVPVVQPLPRRRANASSTETWKSMTPLSAKSEGSCL